MFKLPLLIDTTLVVVLVIVGVIVLIGLIFLFWWISTMNALRRLNVKVDEAESGIDVALTKRYDLLTKELAIVKGVAKHERETLESVIAMRRPEKSASMKEKSEYAGELTKAFDSINIVMERYPELRATENFSLLQRQAFEVEEQLQAARRVYNSNVSTLNQRIVTFPTSLVAGAAGVTKRDFFEAEAKKRDDVEMTF